MVLVTKKMRINTERERENILEEIPEYERAGLVWVTLSLFFSILFWIFLFINVLNGNSRFGGIPSEISFFCFPIALTVILYIPTMFFFNRLEKKINISFENNELIFCPDCGARVEYKFGGHHSFRSKFCKSEKAIEHRREEKEKHKQRKNTSPPKVTLLDELDHLGTIIHPFLNSKKSSLSRKLELIQVSTSEKGQGKRSRHIPVEVKDAVWRRDEGKCVQCGSNEKLEYDHIIPFSKGGANTKRNIQLLCESCNRSKSNKIG